MWVCPKHKALIQEWNEEEVTAKGALKKVLDGLKETKWQHVA